MNTEFWHKDFQVLRWGGGDIWRAEQWQWAGATVVNRGEGAFAP